MVDAKAGRSRHGPVEAPAGHPQHDDVRSERPELIVGEAELLHHSGREVLDDHVGGGDEPKEQVPASRVGRGPA